MSNDQSGETTDMDTNTKTVTDAAARRGQHRSLVDEIWRERGGVASVRPEMWHHLANISRLDQR